VNLSFRQKIATIDKVFKKIQGQSQVQIQAQSEGASNQRATPEGMDAILQVHEEAREELECVICLEVPDRDAHVFSCLEHHLLCSDCVKRNLQQCPVCSQNFQQTPPARNRLAEKMIQRLK
jgi:hypothetical protein